FSIKMGLFKEIKGLGKKLGVQKITDGDIIRSNIITQRVEMIDSLEFTYTHSRYNDFNFAELEKFIKFLDEAISINPENEKAYYLRAICKARNFTQFQGAMNDINIAIKLNPLNENAYTLKGFIHYMKKWSKNTPREKKHWHPEDKKKTILEAVV